jgi:hypothetical protein
MGDKEYDLHGLVVDAYRDVPELTSIVPEPSSVIVMPSERDLEIFHNTIAPTISFVSVVNGVLGYYLFREYAIEYGMEDIISFLEETELYRFILTPQKRQAEAHRICKYYEFGPFKKTPKSDKRKRRKESFESFRLQGNQKYTFHTLRQLMSKLSEQDEQRNGKPSNKQVSSRSLCKLDHTLANIYIYFRPKN